MSRVTVDLGARADGIGWVELCHWLRSGKGERTEMKNILLLIKQSLVDKTQHCVSNQFP